jgi:hypothetical protein
MTLNWPSGETAPMLEEVDGGVGDISGCARFVDMYSHVG